MRIKFYRGRWYAVWREAGETRRISLRTADRDLATRRLHDLQAAPVGPTVGDIVPVYLDDLDARGKDSARARDCWKALSPSFSALRPDQVTRGESRLYVKRRRCQGRSDGTIGKELSVLRAALRWHDRRTPAVVELPPSPAPKDRYLTREERDRLIEAAGAHHVRLFIELGLGTAARTQALLDLTWGRVDFERGIIDLRGTRAHGKGRAVVPMTDRLRAVLQEAQAVATSDYVIEWAGGPVASIKKGFARACRRAGIEGVTPHTLRHSAACWMAEAGVPIAEIAQYMGHSDVSVTYRVYARFSPTHLRNAAKALE